LSTENLKLQFDIYASHWPSSIATAGNTAYEELVYHQICVFLSTGTMQPDGREQNQSYENAFLNL